MSISNIMKSAIQTILRVSMCACFAVVLMMVVGTSQASAADIGDDLLLNGGFEQYDMAIPDNWEATGGWGNPEVSLSSDAARSGTKGMRIQTTQPTNPWIMQIVPFEEGATYNISAWLKAAGVQGSGIGFKLEYYRGNEAVSANHILGHDKTFIMASNQLTGDWQHLELQDTAPPESGLVKVYVRLYGTGMVYFDDVSFVLLEHKPMIELNTDQIIYYSHLTDGQVNVTLDSPAGQLSDKHVDVRIYNEATNVTVATYSQAAVEDQITFPFDPSQMVKEETYQVEVQVLDNANVLLESAKEAIYRFDRPSMIQDDGTLLVDGEPFFAVGAYHVALSDYPYLSQAGINVLQSSGTNNAEVLQNELDTAEQYGLKLMVVLYNGMKVHENAAMTEEFVTRFKDHPAVLAWMIMDEPILNGKTKEELINANRIIRSIDKKHPIYMVEAPITWAYDITAKLTDIFATDYYPLPNLPISLVGEHTVLGKEAAGDDKPVWTVLQAMYNYNHPYLPTINEVRNMAYQSIVNGGQGLAYYSLNEFEFKLRESALWPGLVQFSEELALIGRLVTEAELHSSGKSEVDGWNLWKDEGHLYAMAVNTSDESQQITIPLGLTGYHAELLYGDSYTSMDSQADALQVSLEANQALLYHIIPYETLIEQAMDAANETEGLSTDQQWLSHMQSLKLSLNVIQTKLRSPNPNMTDVVKETVKVFKTIEKLTSRVNSMANGPTKEMMLLALTQIETYVAPIMGSNIEVDMRLADEILVGPMQSNEVSVNLLNLVNSHMKDVKLTLEFPEVFALEPMTQTIAKLKGQETAVKAFAFQIEAPVPEGRYRLVLKLEYKYQGTIISVEKEGYYQYVELLDAKVEPAKIIANKDGSYAFNITISNHVANDQQISLEVDQLPTDMTMQLPEAFVLAGHQDTTVTGSVYLPLSMIEGEYEMAINIKSGGDVTHSLPLSVTVSYNLLHNPSFEQANNLGAAPDGWLMRQGSWVQDVVHDGQYAVALIPDGGTNTFNVINSSGFIPVQPGATYVLRGWVKNASTTGLVQMGLREIKADKVGSVKYVYQDIQPDSEWQYYELAVTPGGLSKYLQVYLSSSTHTNGTAWFDELYVQELLNP
ncbi:carbohydrate binding domain-containing protein [Paenibacillus nasutitermitis]|uniref:CBM-cenC domain-containing protein n=1 Tax=Paenibacillus nasutitermitis TaxID=1652958 RepID=A0A916Z9C0_9BACL|nr:carbohydrate binding domain-containing protein [Paenibacillus nasutitermitis]GGD82676.1 hypothetical protein GCM10010911_46050 [Paenibacillus nasutitermitis]